MSILAEVDVHLDEMVEQVERCFSWYLFQTFLSKGSNIHVLMVPQVRIQKYDPLIWTPMTACYLQGVKKKPVRLVINNMRLNGVKHKCLFHPQLEERTLVTFLKTIYSTNEQ